MSDCVAILNNLNVVSPHLIIVITSPITNNEIRLYYTMDEK